MARPTLKPMLARVKAFFKMKPAQSPVPGAESAKPVVQRRTFYGVIMTGKPPPHDITIWHS